MFLSGAGDNLRLCPREGAKRAGTASLLHRPLWTPQELEQNCFAMGFAKDQVIIIDDPRIVLRLRKPLTRFTAVEAGPRALSFDASAVGSSPARDWGLWKWGAWASNLTKDLAGIPIAPSGEGTGVWFGVRRDALPSPPGGSDGTHSLLK